MCIHKEQLTELDIYHRILRFKNYSVAMMNKSILPARVYLPFLGDTAVLSRGLRYNIDWILFCKYNLSILPLFSFNSQLPLFQVVPGLHSRTTGTCGKSTSGTTDD